MISSKKNRIVIGCLLGLLLVISGCSLWLSNHYVVPIMMYHHVAETAEPRADTVSPDKFSMHMEFLKGKGYHVISLDQFVEQAAHQRPFSYKTVVLTFDDGYKNNYTQAFPILKKHGFTATFFVAPGDIVSDEKNRFMNFMEIKEMSESGMSFGSHGMTQAYLPKMTEEMQASEIILSKKNLEQVLVVPVQHLAYPIGGFNPSIKEKVRQAGYKSALTTNRGYDQSNQDMYELNRIRFSDKDNSNVILWAKLTGFYNFFRKSKDPY